MEWVIIGVLAIAIPSAIFAVSVADTGERRFGVLETIHGIPYPQQNGSFVVVEEMAHADLFLRESVFAKYAKVVVAFDPGNADSIDIGIRENEFWLSYRKYPLYRRGVDAPVFQTKEVTIPLTDVMQDTDQSVDLMFFAEHTGSSVEWRIHEFHASLFSDMPSVPEIKAYIKSILIRERAL